MPGSSSESDSRYALGLTCVISASFLKSLAGILVRLVEEADGWQLRFYRQASFLVCLRARRRVDMLPAAALAAPVRVSG